jgi:hypothetical protein
MIGNRDLGVYLIYDRWDGRIRKKYSYAPKGDFSRGPPACELPPAVVPACAKAIVLDSANAAAKAIVLIFMVASSV